MGDEAIPAPITATELACDNDGFRTIVANIIYQSLPSYQLEKIDESIDGIFKTMGIENENGLSNLDENDFPSIGNYFHTW